MEALDPLSELEKCRMERNGLLSAILKKINVIY